MGESSLGWTDGVDKNWHSYQRTIASTTMQDPAVFPAEFPLPTYTASAAGVRVNTANSHLLQIMGDGTNYVRLRRLTIRQANIASAASTLDLRVFRLSTAGTGGSSLSARALDESDTTPYAGSVRTGVTTSKGTEGDQLLGPGTLRLGLTNANPITDVNKVEWVQQPGAKPIVVGNGTASGLAVKNIGSTGTEVDIEAEFVLTPYL